MRHIQETHCTEKDQIIWKNKWGGDAYFSNGTSSARGVAIFIKRSLKHKIVNKRVDDQGRILSLDVVINDVIFNIVSIYAPNDDKPMFFNQLEEFLSQSATEHTIVIDDFYLVLDNMKDQCNCNNVSNNKKSASRLKQIMETLSLIEVWRVRNPDLQEYSWSKIVDGQLKKASRLDYAIVSKGLDSRVTNTMYTNGIMTDHRAFQIAIETCLSDRGRSFWKFNNSLLNQPEFKKFMTCELNKDINSLVQKRPDIKWEKIKARIKATTLKYSRKQKADDDLLIAQLAEKIHEYESRMLLTKEDTSLLENTKTDFNEVLQKKVNGQIFRSKTRWYELGEKNTKYFFNLEKRNYNAKTCFKLLHENGSETVNQNEILQMRRDYYKKLYAKNNEVRFELINETGITVSEQSRCKQNADITLEEITDALNSMKREKTSGYDGITVEFYIAFWDILKCHLFDVLKYCIRVDRLYESAQTGILNLIPKPDKDARFLKNLRPITLLNVDYKLLEKIIANRMMFGLEEIISSDQNGFLPGRRISVNIRKLLDLI